MQNFVEDTRIVGGAVTNPAATATIVLMAGLKAGSYDVQIQSLQGGTVDATKLADMLFWVGSNPVGTLLSLATAQEVRARQITVNGSQDLKVTSNAGAGSGAVYPATITATRRS